MIYLLAPLSQLCKGQSDPRGLFITRYDFFSGLARVHTGRAGSRLTRLEYSQARHATRGTSRAGPRL